MMMVCDSPISQGQKRGQLATGTTAGYNRHRRAGEPSCAPCLAAASGNAKAWSKANPEGQKRSSAAWRKANPDKIRAKHLRNYNLTLEAFDALLTQQDGKCAICSTTEPGAWGFHIDHDHACCDFRGSCGRCVRGLLCSRCNFRLGVIENAPFAAAARTYLRRYQ